MWSFHTESSAKAEATITINQESEKVFDFVASDFVSNYPRWAPEIELVTARSEGPIRVDYRLSLRRAETTDETEYFLRVTIFEPPTRFSYESLSEPYHGHYFFSDLEQALTTQLTFEFQLDEIELAMRPFIKLIRNAIQEGVTQTVSNIKQLVETQT